jgi:hypothetical protein
MKKSSWERQRISDRIHRIDRIKNGLGQEDPGLHPVNPVNPVKTSHSLVNHPADFVGGRTCFTADDPWTGR